MLGSAAQAASDTPDDGQLTCPPLRIRAGASTLAVGVPGKTATGSDLRYQVTITRTARDCTLGDGQITVHIGVEGRVIVGAAGAPPSVDVPLRIAVVQQGVQDRVVFTKFYRTSVPVADSAGYANYSFVADDVVYPAPDVASGDNYIFYVGFDPNGLKPEPAPRPKSVKRAKRQG